MYGVCYGVKTLGACMSFFRASLLELNARPVTRFFFRTCVNNAVLSTSFLASIPVHYTIKWCGNWHRLITIKDSFLSAHSLLYYHAWHKQEGSKCGKLILNQIVHQPCVNCIFCCCLILVSLKYTRKMRMSQIVLNQFVFQHYIMYI